jgi:hypothetical protein
MGGKNEVRGPPCHTEAGDGGSRLLPRVSAPRPVATTGRSGNLRGFLERGRGHPPAQGRRAAGVAVPGSRWTRVERRRSPARRARHQAAPMPRRRIRGTEGWGVARTSPSLAPARSCHTGLGRECRRPRRGGRQRGLLHAGVPRAGVNGNDPSGCCKLAGTPGRRTGRCQVCNQGFLGGSSADTRPSRSAKNASGPGRARGRRSSAGLGMD